jgi:hypothetical protein
MIVTCPECKQKLRLSAEVPAGKRIKCPKCAAVFSAADDEEAAPSRKDAVTRSAPKPARSARPQPDLEEDEDDSPRKSKRGRDDEDDEEAPRAKSKRRDLEEDDEDEDEDERPVRRRRRKRVKKSNAAVLYGAIGGGVAFIVSAGVVLLLVLGRGGASAQQEQVLKDMLQIMRDFRECLKSVKDQNSAKTAAGQLNTLSDRMEALGKRGKGLPKITQAEADRLKAKYKPEMDQLEQGMQQLGMQAGMNSAGEASFMAALQKSAQTAQRVEAMLK